MKIEGCKVRPATETDCYSIAPFMRDADTAEVWAQAAMLPLEALLYSFHNSESYTITDNGLPIGMFGIEKNKNHLVGKRCIWLLASDQIMRHKKQFVSQCRDYLHILGAGHKVYNYVDAENAASLLWLKWMGFTIMEAEPHGWLKKPFHYAEKVIPCVL